LQEFSLYKEARTCFYSVILINIHMPHTLPSQDGDNNNIPQEGTQKPQGERNISHFDKRRTNTHSGHGKSSVPHANEGHKSHHRNSKPGEHTARPEGNRKPHHPGTGLPPKKFFGSMRQNQSNEGILP